MKIGLYSPYISVFGGGERYLLTIAVLLSKNNQVDLYHTVNTCSELELRKSIYSKFCLDISLIEFRLFEGIFDQKYDLFFHMANDRVEFENPGHVGVLIFQVPPISNALLNNPFFATWNERICNSKFVQKYILETLGESAFVLYPPIELLNFQPSQIKSNLILSVGRFFTHRHCKNHHLSIEFYKKLVKNSCIDWKYIIAGQISKDGHSYFDLCKELSRGSPIEVLPNLEFPELQSLYAKSKIYWHSTGYGDESNNPQLREHFGLAIVEAMSAGCVPLAFAEGGTTEIIQHGFNGFLWKSEDELLKMTTVLIEDEDSRVKMADNARKSAAKFGIQAFENRLADLVNGLQVG